MKVPGRKSPRPRGQPLYEAHQVFENDRGTGEWLNAYPEVPEGYDPNTGMNIVGRVNQKFVIGSKDPRRRPY